MYDMTIMHLSLNTTPLEDSAMKYNTHFRGVTTNKAQVWAARILRVSLYMDLNVP